METNVWETEQKRLQRSKVWEEEEEEEEETQIKSGIFSIR